MIKYLLTCIAVAMAFATQLAFAAPADDLKTLIEQGRSREAYELGSRHPELLGNPGFDFFFGLAATDAGHAGEGVLALERYLIQFPNITVARVELARAYFILGEDARAREEFQNVLRDKPPANIQTTVEQYLDAIRLREARYQTTSTAYIEAGMGIDSNVNGGVGSSSINLPVLGNVTVAAAGVRKGDNFSHLAAGGQISHPIAPGLALFGGIGVEAKLNSTHSASDLMSSSLAGGASLIKDKDVYRLSASQNVLAVENDRFRSVNGVNGEWNHQLDELQSLQTTAQVARFNYTGTNEVRNADYVGLGLTYRRAFVSTKWQPVLSLNASVATEDNQRQRPDLGRDIHGGRAGVSLSPTAQWGLNLGLSYQESRYNGPDTLLSVVRKDGYAAMDMSATYLWNKNISIRGEILLSDNQSNLSLYEYKRNTAAVKLRYEFK